jgi:hypothetical protein
MTTTAKTMAADNKDNEVDGDGGTGDSATGDGIRRRRRRQWRRTTKTTRSMATDGVNDPRSRREGEHKKNTSEKGPP